MFELEDNHKCIRNNVSRFNDLSQEELDYFFSILQRKTLSKKQFLLREGETCDFEAFITKGCVKMYSLDAKDNEVVLTLAIEDWWVSDVKSMSDKSPSRFFIETIEPTEFLILKREDKETLLKLHPKFERVFRILIQNHLASFQDRLYKNYAFPAIKRYQEFMERYAHIAQRVPQLVIASYLGISPEFLSKIRKELSMKKS